MELKSLDVGSLLVGANYGEDFETRFKTILKEVYASNGQTILFIDEIHIVIGAGALSFFDSDYTLIDDLFIYTQYLYAFFYSDQVKRFV